MSKRRAAAKRGAATKQVQREIAEMNRAFKLEDVEIKRGKNKSIHAGSMWDSQGRPGWKPWVYIKVSDNAKRQSMNVFLSMTPAEAVKLGRALIAHGEGK